jgi:hypothetical protein
VLLYVIKEFDHLESLFINGQQTARYTNANHGDDISPEAQTAAADELRKLNASIAVLDFLVALDPTAKSFSWNASNKLFDISCQILRYYGFSCQSVDRIMSVDHRLLHNAEAAADGIVKVDPSKLATIVSRFSGLTRAALHLLKARGSLNPSTDKRVVISGQKVSSSILNCLLHLIHQVEDADAMERLTLCKESSSELLGYLSTSTSSSRDDHSEDSIPMSGMIVGEIVGKCCQNADLNFLAQMKRLLFMKLESLSSGENDRILCLNAISCVIASLSKRILSSQVEDQDLSQLLSRLVKEFEAVALNEEFVMISRSSVIFRRLLVDSVWNQPMLQPMVISIMNKLFDRLSTAMNGNSTSSKATGSAYDADIELLSRGCSLQGIPTGK